MKLNSTIKLRISSEMKKEIKDISNQTGFREGDLIRYLLNRSLQQLKADSIKANGYNNLEFTLRQQ